MGGADGSVSGDGTKLFVAAARDDADPARARATLEKARNALASVEDILGALLDISRLDTGEANVGTSSPLESIPACVIAGVSLAGGQGRTASVVLGSSRANSSPP